jgi:glycosyl-4,4'-diaponeurosporenoate acyltransferase
MPVRLPTGWIIALNVLGWPVIQLGLAWVFTRLPSQMFDREPGWLSPGRTEARAYEQLILIRQWKRLLPDGAPWLQGFAKQHLVSTESGYLSSFVTETRRGEWAHWAMMLAGAVFLLWNPPWADGVMIGYAVAANMPCIVTQRYNRWRIGRLLRSSVGRRKVQI